MLASAFVRACVTSPSSRDNWDLMHHHEIPTNT
jgi:hypothetical protein